MTLRKLFNYCASEILWVFYTENWNKNRFYVREAWIRLWVGRIRAPRFNSPPSGTNSTTTAVVTSWSAYFDAYNNDDDGDDDNADDYDDYDDYDIDEKALYFAFPSV